MNKNNGSIALALLVPSVLLAAACGGGSAPQTSTPAPAERPPAAPAPSAPPAAASPTGSARIGGTIHFTGQAPALKPVDMNADPGCAKKHATPPPNEVLVLGPGNTMANVFVRVSGGLPAGSWPVPSEPAVIDQNGCHYVPHVLGVRVGQPVKILNSDGLLHNVHALPQVNQSFNRAMPATVTEAAHTFDKAEGMFKVKCDVHPWMGAWVAVLEHPFFDVTAEDGRFEISGLPAGTYEIEAWHERLGTQKQSVTVADGATATADLTFSSPGGS